MQNRPIKAILMAVFFMFHLFQDNPRSFSELFYSDRAATR